jgi:hypothetical protein
MFGLSKSDEAQKRMVDAVRDAFMPYEGDYAIRLKRGEAAIVVSSSERDLLMNEYTDAVARAVRIGMATMLVGICAMIAFAMAKGLDPAFWQVAIIIAITMPIYYWPAWAMRSRALALPPRTRSIPEDFFAAWERRTIAERAWSALILPALIIPFLWWRLAPNFPPAVIDDYVVFGFLAWIAFALVRATFRKIRASAVR